MAIGVMGLAEVARNTAGLNAQCCSCYAVLLLHAALVVVFCCCAATATLLFWHGNPGSAVNLECSSLLWCCWQ